MPGRISPADWREEGKLVSNICACPPAPTCDPGLVTVGRVSLKCGRSIVAASLPTGWFAETRGKWEGLSLLLSDLHSFVEPDGKVLS